MQLVWIVCGVVVLLLAVSVLDVERGRGVRRMLSVSEADQVVPIDIAGYVDAS